MKFDYQHYLPAELYRQVRPGTAAAAQRLYACAAARKQALPADRPLVLAAADHNARMISEYRGDPLAFCCRQEYLARLMRMLESPYVDGVEASPDVMEALMLLNDLRLSRGQPDVLSGKMLIGTANRGGLKGAVWELDDFCSGFTLERMQRLRLDGAKFMLRVDLDDERSKRAMEYCTDLVNRAAAADFPVFIEMLMVKRVDGNIVLQTDTLSLCRSVGVAAALGSSAMQKWLEVPRSPDYAQVAQATMCPLLVVPDESETEPLDIVAEYTRERDMADNVCGILLGRNILYHANDPYPLAHAVGLAWHEGMSPQQAYEAVIG